MPRQDDREWQAPRDLVLGAASWECGDGRCVRLDSMFALGRNSLEQGDLRTALKYFSMVLGMDEGNQVAAWYLNITRQLITERKAPVADFPDELFEDDIA